MYTIILIDIFIAIISYMIIRSTRTYNHFDYGFIGDLLNDLIDCIGIILTIAVITVGLLQFNLQNFKSKTVETPAKYTNQTYYIDNNNQLYIEQNGITKNFGRDITSKIEYRDLAKSPSIQFETKTKINSDKPDHWIPFKYETERKTSIAKIILPKSALTQKLTKVDVLNQSIETDLTLSN